MANNGHWQNWHYRTLPIKDQHKNVFIECNGIIVMIDRDKYIYGEWTNER